MFSGLFLLPVAPAKAQDDRPAAKAYPEAIQKADEILNKGYQTKLPVNKAPVVIDMPGAALPAAFSQIGLVLLVGLLIVLVVFVFNNNRFVKNGDEGLGFATAEGLDFSSLQISDPQKLAANGEFSAAIHALLLRALLLTSHHIDSTWPRSLTSREILNHRQLPDAARSDLGRLINRVEVHHFGGLSPISADYSLCQDIYDHLVHNLEGEKS